MGLTAVTFRTTFMISLVILTSQGDVSSELQTRRESVGSQFSSIKNGNSQGDVSSDLQTRRESVRLQLSSIKNVNNQEDVSRVSSDLRNLRELISPLVTSINNEIWRAYNHFEVALADVSVVSQQSRDLPRSSTDIASIFNEIMRASKDFEAALADGSRVLQQSRDMNWSWPLIASINNGMMLANNHFEAALAHFSSFLLQSRDLFWPNSTTINNEIMLANDHFEAALANVVIYLQQSSSLPWFWPRISRDMSWPLIASINNGITFANNHFEAALAHFSSVLQQSKNLSWSLPHIAQKKKVAPSTAKPTESPPNEWKSTTTSSYKDEAPSTANPTASTPKNWASTTTSSYNKVAPSTAKPTESQPKTWASTTTSSYKDEESTSGKNLTIPKTTKSSLCGPAFYSQKDAIKNRIVFGNDTSISRHPYQLALEGAGSHICGGSILTEVWALTAAHCVYDQPLKSLAFRAGSSLREEGGTIHHVKYYIYHENYTMGSFDYDVAVVRVKEAFVYDSWTSPVNLNLHPYNGGVMVVATAWGYKQRALLTKPKLLQSADFLTLDSETCRRRYPGQVTERMLCAEDPNNITDICTGDSGGALVLKGSHTLVGIVSWSYSCADGRPSVYTNVSSVATWIRERVC